MEECHLSVESFHSSGLFLASRKRSKLQQVIIGSKKFKKQTQETCSKSYVKVMKYEAKKKSEEVSKSERKSWYGKPSTS